MSAVDPIAQFAALFARAGDNAPFDHVPVTLATSSRDARPSVRIVLLRGVDERGFVFFTNYTSRKARELAENPFAALCCYWPWLDEQVRVEGMVERIAEQESDDYFASRPRGSQIGAWASDQSQVLASRAALEQRYHDTEAQYEGRDVPRPPYWGGFRLVPARIEFWRAAEFRLHDRHVFVRDGNTWRSELLYP